MKERPILFSGPMVRAILEGRKTQTRRIVKGAPECPSGWYPDAYNKTVNWTFWGPRNSPDHGRCSLPLFRCPYGQPGDRLWVRETGWEPPEPTMRDLREGADTWPPYAWDADGISEAEAEQIRGWGWKRRPSIHMPRWASRITLEIESVRVERLQEITPEDCRAEGMPHDNNDIGVRYGFGQLWNSINGKGSWAANPWVWVITFRKVEAK